MLSNKTIQLRALEPGDIDLLYGWENNTLFWSVSNTLTPYSRHVLEQYLQNAHLDLHTTKQVRLMIELNAGLKTIGCIDLFDFEPLHRRAGVGILIAEDGEQRNGYASSALELLIQYAFGTLNLNQLYCSVAEGNEGSLKLFAKFGFKKTGVKKEWLCRGDAWQDEVFLQLFRRDAQTVQQLLS